MATPKLSPAALTLILRSEGIDQPYRWPGLGSGITLGYGCDIGADPKSLNYWEGILTPAQIDLLRPAQGVTGRAAKQMETRFSSITISPSQAIKVFLAHTAPTEIKKTLRTFPGVLLFPEDVLGAMVSLVYNRGTSLAGDRRREMAKIAEICRRFESLTDGARKSSIGQYMFEIAQQIRSMKRLWKGGGLNARRENEARLIEAAIPNGMLSFTNFGLDSRQPSKA
jgi:GH24 family phage-related lysozyme (muramidase)